MLNKEHNTIEGIKKVKIKASLNSGLTKLLKEVFHETLPSHNIKQKLENSKTPLANNIKPEWMAGLAQDNLISLLQFKNLKQKVV